MRRHALYLLPLVLLTGACAWPVKQVAKSRHALWTITNEMCIPNAARTGSPTPCAEVDPAAGYVVMKDIRGKAQYLLMPTARISGIESPALLQPDTPNYFFDAWAKRNYVIAALRKPLSDDQVSLAINPTTARSQDHLHIHIECIRPDVREALAADDARITAQWSDWTWEGTKARVRRLPENQLRSTDLFKLIAADVPGAASNMGIQTIFVTGAVNKGTAAPGEPDLARGVPDPHAKDLYVVVWHVPHVRGDGEGAEHLQDHSCSVADARLPSPAVAPVVRP